MIRKVFMGLLLAVLGVGVSASALAQTSTWTATPKLEIGDASGQKLGDAGSPYAITYANRGNPIRIHVSVDMEQTGGAPPIDSNNLPLVAALAGRAGFQFITAGVWLEAGGTATTSDIVASFASASANLSWPAESSNPGGAPDLSLLLASGEGWEFTFNAPPALTPPAGAWCTLSSDACTIELGYIEFTPNIPTGGTVTFQIADPVNRELPVTFSIWDDLAPLEKADTFDFNTAAGAPVEAQFQHPSVDLEGADGKVLEGETLTFTANVEAAVSAAAKVRLVAMDIDTEANDYTLGMADIATSSSMAQLTFTANLDMLDEPEEDVKVMLEVVSGPLALADPASMFTITIVNLVAASTTATTTDIVDGGGNQGFSIRPVGTLFMTNSLANPIEFEQGATDDSLVNLTILEAGSPPTPDFEGSRVIIPPDTFSDSGTGRNLMATFMDSNEGRDGDAPDSLVFPGQNGGAALAAARAQLEILDIEVVDRSGAALANSLGGIDVCLPHDNEDAVREGEADPVLSRFDGTEWVKLADPVTLTANPSGLVCGSTLEFSSFAVFYTSTATPDVNGDDEVDESDALVLYYSYVFRSNSGVGTGR